MGKKKQKKPVPNMEAADMMEPVLYGEMTGAMPFFVPLMDEDAYKDLLDGEGGDPDDPESKLRQ